MLKSKTAAILFILLPCSALFSQSSKYQFGFHFKAGLSHLVFRYPSYPSFEQLIQDGVAAQFSPGIALFGRYNLSQQFYLQTGIGYELSGYRIKEFDVIQATENMPEPVYLGKATGAIQYHDLNLSLQAKARPFESLPGLYFLSGVSNLFNVGRKKTILLTFDNGDVMKTRKSLASADTKTASWNPRGDIGLGYEFKAFGKSKIFVEPAFGYTFFPVYTESQGRYGQYVAGLNF